MKNLILFIFLLFNLSCNNHQHSGGHDKLHEEHASTEKIQATDLIGKTIEYRYGESIYHVTIDTDTKMHWEAKAGDEKGAFENEDYKIVSIDDQKLFITWGEANGIGVSQVLDFEKGIVYNHLLRGRDISIGTGQIRILD